MIQKNINAVVTATNHTNYKYKADKDKKDLIIIDRPLQLLLVFRHNYNTDCHGYCTVVNVLCAIK